MYLGPNSIIQMGVSIGDTAVVGAMSFVNKDIQNGGKVQDYFMVYDSCNDRKFNTERYFFGMGFE